MKDIDENNGIGPMDEFIDAGEDNGEEDEIITLTDEETGEEIDFILDDTFEFNGKTYVVLLKPCDDPDYDYESIIMENVDRDGESMLQTLNGDEAEVIYDYYDKLCVELYGDDEESDE